MWSMTMTVSQFFHISTFMSQKYHWFPISARIQFKIPFSVYTAFLGLAPSYLCKLIMGPLSAISDLQLPSVDRNDLLVPRSRTSTSQQCVFPQLVPSCAIISVQKSALKFTLARPRLGAGCQWQNEADSRLRLNWLDSVLLLKILGSALPSECSIIGLRDRP